MEVSSSSGNSKVPREVSTGENSTGGGTTTTNDRDTRIQARRQRVEVRNASKDDESRKKKLQVNEQKQKSRGQQQIADSLNQLDRRKIASIQHVTSIRVEADDHENTRRIEEEEKKHLRYEKLQQEAISSGAKNAAVEMRWADLYDYTMPQELHQELEIQQANCTDILQSKDALIKNFQLQLKQKDEEYVNALKKQSEEIENLIQRMGQQYREMQEEYEMELQQMEEAFLKERDELLSQNKNEIDSLFEKRREMEMIYMENKQQRDEQYQKEIEDLRIKDTEDYNELKIKLETNIQTLEQQLEEMRATYQLNTEKLEYNYRVLTERDMENSTTLTQQKRKLGRLKDTLSALITKYNQTDARDRQQNQQLTEEYRRLTKQYKDLQKKYAHFEQSDAEKYQEVWQMHEEEAIEKIQKLLKADKIIHEQQLGLNWKPPTRPITEFHVNSSSSTNNNSSKKKTATTTLQASSTKKMMDDQLSVTTENLLDTPKTVNENDHTTAATTVAGEGGQQCVSSTKLKHMLSLLASEAGFLVNGNVQQALESLPDDEAELVKADMILRALGVENEDDMERLLRLFFEDPRIQVPNDFHGASSSSTPTNSSSPKWDLKVGPEDVVRVIKKFVEEANEQKRTSSITRLLRHSSAGVTGNTANVGTAKAEFEEHEKQIARMKTQKEEKIFWDSVTKVVPPRTIRVMETLETALTQYNEVLNRRKNLIDEVGSLKNQNAELKKLLKQYIGSSINNDLIVPPTQMQTYQ